MQLGEERPCSQEHQRRTSSMCPPSVPWRCLPGHLALVSVLTRGPVVATEHDPAIENGRPALTSAARLDAESVGNPLDGVP
jgi:hypothetical protein